MNAADFVNLFAAVAITLMIIAAVLAKRNDKDDCLLFFERKKPFICVSAVFFLLAAAVRIIDFGSYPGGVNQDEAMAAADAFALATNGTDRLGMPFPAHFTAWGYGQMSVLLSYVQAIFIKIFGMSIVIVRLPMLIVSLAGIAVLFFAAKSIFGGKSALFALLLAAINPWHIMQSRWSLDCNIFPHFVLFGVFFLQKSISRRNETKLEQLADNKNTDKKYLYVSMVFFALSMYGYGVSFFSVPFLLLGACLIMLKKRMIKLDDAAICLAVYLTISLPVFAVMVINTFGLKTVSLPFMTLPFFPNTIRMNNLIFFSDDIIAQLWANITALYDNLVLQKNGLIWNVVRPYGALYTITPPLFCAGLHALYKRAKRAELPRGSFLYLVWIGAALFCGLIVEEVNTNRINIIFYPIIVISAVGLEYILRRINSKIAAAGAVCVCLILFASFCVTYFVSNRDEMDNAFNKGFEECVEYAENGGFDRVYITDTTIFGKLPQVNEILLIYAARLEPDYITGAETAEQTLLPYNERYRVIDLKALPFVKLDNSVIIFRQADLSLLDEEKYHIELFGVFGVAVVKY